MKAWMRGFAASRTPCQALSMSSRQQRASPRDDRSVAAADLPRNPPYALQVVRARGRKAGLHDVNTEHGELPRYLEFLGARHRRARGLLAVA